MATRRNSSFAPHGPRNRSLFRPRTRFRWAKSTSPSSPVSSRSRIARSLRCRVRLGGRPHVPRVLTCARPRSGSTSPWTGRHDRPLSRHDSGLSLCRSGHGSIRPASQSSFGVEFWLLASASIRLASTAMRWPLTKPSLMHRAPGVSNTWRSNSLSRNRPCRFLEKVEWSATRWLRSSRQNQRYARFRCTAAQSRRSDRMPKQYPTSIMRISSSGSTDGRPVRL